MKKYDSYKDSGIEWIGEIPSHWTLNKVKHNFSFKTGFTPPSGKTEYYENGTHVWINISDLQEKKVHDSANKLTDRAIEDYKPEIVPKGSLLYSFKLSVGRVGFNTIDCYTNEAIFSIDPNGYLNLNFFYYSLPEQIIKNANENIYGAKILNQDLIKNALLVAPPPEEQTAIAAYLDRKTAEIDELIADKKRLLELYEEEKTAIINQAVTKGINPDVPMKDSGIEWLGEIPEHWEVKRLKYVGKIKYGLGQPPKHKLDGLPIIRATNVFRGRIDEKDLIFVDPDDIPYERDPILRTNDIIVVRSGAYTADSAIIPSKFDGAVTGYDMVFSCNKDHNPKFISFGLLSDYILKRQLIMHSLRAAQPHLNREELGETLIAVPPYNIQQSIVNHIETECTLIDEKIAKTEKLIVLLTEYRTALISEVVTGKMKVI